MGSDSQSERFCDKFCRRFMCSLTMVSGGVLLVLTALFRTGHLQAFFFSVETDSTIADIQLPIIYSAAVLSLTALLTLGSVPCTNAWIVTLAAMLCNSGFVIKDLIHYVQNYDLTKAVFEFDGYLIAWFLTLFLSTLLSIISTCLAYRYQRGVVMTTLLLRKQWADGQAMTMVTGNKAASIASAPTLPPTLPPAMYPELNSGGGGDMADHHGNGARAQAGEGGPGSSSRPVSLVARDGEFTTFM